jgi:hypothetical protein
VSLFPFNLLTHSHGDLLLKLKTTRNYCLPEVFTATPVIFDQAFWRHQEMDPGFLPAEYTVRHFVNHKFTLELGPSINCLGKASRNTLIAIVVIKCSFVSTSCPQPREYKGQVATYPGLLQAFVFKSICLEVNASAKWKTIIAKGRSYAFPEQCVATPCISSQCMGTVGVSGYRVELWTRSEVSQTVLCLLLEPGTNWLCI